MTNLGPLTTTYIASGANCQSTFVTEASDDERIQYGQLDTKECYPPDFTAFKGYYYSPGICPSGHTYVCETGVDTSITQATCCPTGYMCRKDLEDTDPFACSSTFDISTVLTLEQYWCDFETGGPATVVNTISMPWELSISSGTSVQAFGPIVRRSSGDPEWSTTSTGSPGTAPGSTGQGPTTASVVTTVSVTTTAAPVATTSAQSGGGGLGVGASAGIGVGVGFGLILFIGSVAAAYIIGRRRRGRGPREEAKGPVGGIPAPGQEAGMNEPGWKPAEQTQSYRAVGIDENGRSIELQANVPVELPGQESSGHDGHARA